MHHPSNSPLLSNNQTLLPKPHLQLLSPNYHQRLPLLSHILVAESEHHPGYTALPLPLPAFMATTEVVDPILNLEEIEGGEEIGARCGVRGVFGKLRGEWHQWGFEGVVWMVS